MSTVVVPATTHQAAQARRLGGTRVPCYVFDSHRDLARSVAQTVAGVIRERNALGHHAVLGLAAGRTTVGAYRELVRLHRDEGLDFSGVVTFNLDEYYGLSPERHRDAHRWYFCTEESVDFVLYRGARAGFRCEVMTHFTAGGPEVKTGLRREIVDLMRKRYEQQNALPDPR